MTDSDRCCVRAVSRRVINRMRQQLNAHAQSTSGALARYNTTVQTHVTRHIRRFQRHLAAALNTDWLTFPNTLLNLSSSHSSRSTGHLSTNDHRQSWAEDARMLALASLLEIDEAQIVYAWTQRFWTRYDVMFCYKCRFSSNNLTLRKCPKPGLKCVAWRHRADGRVAKKWLLPKSRCITNH